MKGLTERWSPADASWAPAGTEEAWAAYVAGLHAAPRA